MKACIFDLDGTLTDTLESLVFSVNASLNEMGKSSSNFWLNAQLISK